MFKRPQLILVYFLYSVLKMCFIFIVSGPLSSIRPLKQRGRKRSPGQLTATEKYRIKGTPEYEFRRESNNLAVQRSRARSKEQVRKKEEMNKKLVAENSFFRGKCIYSHILYFIVSSTIICFLCKLTESFEAVHKYLASCDQPSKETLMRILVLPP